MGGRLRDLFPIQRPSGRRVVGFPPSPPGPTNTIIISGSLPDAATRAMYESSMPSESSWRANVVPRKRLIRETDASGSRNRIAAGIDV